MKKDIKELSVYMYILRNMNTWENCVAWKQMINDTILPYSRALKRKIVLTHDGLYYESDDPHAQITEESMDKIKRGAEDVVKRYERCPPYSKKNTNSYTGKHHLEEEDGYYMTNGEFILAVFCSGVVSDSPQDWLNLSRGAVGNMKKMNLNITFPMRLKKVG
jgi:hypothetical protein